MHTVDHSQETKQKESIKKLKTGAFERKWALTKASVIAGSKLMIGSASNALVLDKDKRAKKQKETLRKQSEYLVNEIGKLKGSIVKFGQMMALWGEHFLPKELTDALHTLENHTVSVEWPVIQQVLEENISPALLAELTIDPEPIGAASLGQVHRAYRRHDRKYICLKVQYPGVCDAIDTDLDTFKYLIKLTNVIPITRELEEWFNDLRDLLTQEINYHNEFFITQRIFDRLKDDDRYIVPKVYPEYSSDVILATSFEPGVSITSEDILSLPQYRRNRLAENYLDLCWREIFEWGEMQTDPNFGNYAVRLSEDKEQLILFDFGAVRAFDPKVLAAGKQLIKGAAYEDYSTIKQALLSLGFFKQDAPEQILENFAALCFKAIVPFAAASEGVLYAWEESTLANKVLKKASQSSISRYFAIPPKDTMFVTRKLIGTYTLMTVLKAQTAGYSILKQYFDIETPEADTQKKDAPKTGIQNTDKYES